MLLYVVEYKYREEGGKTSHPTGNTEQRQKENIVPKLTTEDLNNPTRETLTRSQGSAEVIPAREFLAELAAKLGA